MNDDELPESLVQDDEEAGFIDLDLRLTRLDVRPDGTFLAEGRGRHNGRTLGFALELNAEWEATRVGDSDSFFYWGTGAVRSIGPESDSLLNTLAELYDLPVSKQSMRNETRVAVVGLVDDPRLLPNRPARMKLFFESEEADRYAEVYVNVIAAEHRIELHEKDPGYRKPLLRALAEEDGSRSD
jgi:hypothetical protein